MQPPAIFWQAALRQVQQFATQTQSSLLSLETSSSQASLLLVKPAPLAAPPIPITAPHNVYQHSLAAKAWPSEALVQALAEAFASLALSPQHVGGIVVGHGPGSFTGVRVGLATAQGLVAGSQARLQGISSLASQALSAYLQQQTPPSATSTPILVVQDARRDELYAAVYTHHWQQGKLQQNVLLPDTVISPTHLQQKLHTCIPQGTRLCCVGDYAEAWTKAQSTCDLGPPAMPHAIASLLLATNTLGPPLTNWTQQVLPQYLRLSSAEQALLKTVVSRADTSVQPV